MATATKRTTRRKRTVKRATVTTTAPVEQRVKFDPVVFYEQVGKRVVPSPWGDPRITRYCQTDAERKKYVGRKGFSAQDLNGPIVFGNYVVQELGSYVDDSESPPVTLRIVEVKEK